MLFWGLSTGAFAQQRGDAEHKQRQQENWEQFSQFRRDFMTEKIGLTEQEAEKFFPLYDEMEKAKWNIDREARGFARKISRSDSPVSDTEYEKAAEALLEKEEKIARIEREYFEKFKTILSSEKLFKFKNAQNKFPKALMKWRAEQKKNGKGMK